MLNNSFRHLLFKDSRSKCSMVRNVSSLIARSYNRPHVQNAFSIRLRAMLLLLDNFFPLFHFNLKGIM